MSYAVKYETHRTVKSSKSGCRTTLPLALPYEAQIYKVLGPQPWLPKLYFYVGEANVEIMVLEKVGPNLEQLKRFCRGKFSLKTVLTLGEKLVRSIS